VSVLSQRAQLPSRDTFAWTVLAALAGDVDAWAEPGGKLTVMLRKTRELSRSG
jgi:serine/threonine-protein kinase RsbW